MQPAPSITGFLPGHDYRMLSTVTPNQTETVGIQIQFSEPMDCDSVHNSIALFSNTIGNVKPILDNSTISCQTINAEQSSTLVGTPATIWTFSANLVNVANGVHALTVINATSSAQNSSTGVTDRFFVPHRSS